MSKVIGPFRHTGSLGTLSGGTFIPSRGARDAIRPKPGDMPARAKTAADKLAREAVAATGTLQRINDSLNRVATGLRSIADQRRAATLVVRDAIAWPSPITRASAPRPSRPPTRRAGAGPDHGIRGADSSAACFSPPVLDGGSRGAPFEFRAPAWVRIASRRSVITGSGRFLPESEPVLDAPSRSSGGVDHRRPLGDPNDRRRCARHTDLLKNRWNDG